MYLKDKYRRKATYVFTYSCRNSCQITLVKGALDVRIGR